MRSAAIGVRSSWLTSATNSRSRSRSASSMRKVPDSRSAITLNWAASSSTSSTPDAVARSSRSPWATRPATPRSRWIGAVTRRAATTPNTTEATSASRPAPTIAERIWASVASREVYGSEIVMVSSSPGSAPDSPGPRNSKVNVCWGTSGSRCIPCSSSPVASGGSARATTSCVSSEISTVARARAAAISAEFRRTNVLRSSGMFDCGPSIDRRTRRSAGAWRPGQS